MSIDTDLTHDTDPTIEPVTIGDPVTSPQHLVEVRRRPGPAAALGAGASLVAVAYLARAAGGGGALDWVLAVVLGVLGIAHLAALLDARAPLLVADELGVRLRLGRTWVGLPWAGLHEVEHQARRGWWRDGLLTVRTHYVQRVLEDLDPRARRVARINRRLHRAPLAVPLGLGTRVVGAEPDLTSALRELADGRAPVLEIAPAEEVIVRADDPDDEPDVDLDEDLDQEPDRRGRRLPDPRPAMAHLIGVVAARLERPPRGDDGPVEADALVSTGSTDGGGQTVVASETPAPVRKPVVAARAEVRQESRATPEPDASADPDGSAAAAL
jgi:cytoskeleton protein RodZ